jgi:hypothetical protein
MESLPVEQLSLEPSEPSAAADNSPRTLSIAPDPENSREPADWQEAV